MAENITKNKKITTSDIVLVGLMAALCFVSNFFRIPLPSVVGNTAIHFGNIFCLLAGLILGSVKGGLSAGIGSMIFDLVYPGYAASAPFTLVFKFMLAFVCGLIAYSNKSQGKILWKNIVGSICGSFAYVVLYISKSFITQYYFYKSSFEATIVAVGQKLIVSSINAVIAVILAVILAPIFKAALSKTKLYKK